jgi:hypothetical protein
MFSIEFSPVISPLCRSDIPVTASRPRVEAQIRAARAEGRMGGMVGQPEEPADPAVVAVDDANRIDEDPRPDSPPSYIADESLKATSDSISAAESKSSLAVDDFPAFFRVKDGQTCRVHTDPDEYALSLRNVASVRI